MIAVIAVAALPLLYVVQMSIDAHLEREERSKRRVARRTLRRVEREMRAETIIRRIEREMTR